MNALNQSDIDEYNNFISGNASKETLNILAKSKYFTKYYKDISTNESNIDIVKGVADIYNAIFNDQDQTSLRISNECTIDYPSKYKKKLIDACSLLSPEIKLD